ncbi:zinc-binding dehydrogenase [Microbacterium sp. EST19A]|uniref:zinc-binding dehydrogenase n=1 Tax=Microbacterium sp. EST19A TaxID=2862681 RepID=UPI001CBB4BC6|nr:zinc-binding dehydrogenase [Microbacterium sp. EST19A]
MIHGAAGGVGAFAVQIARDAGAVVIGTGRSHHRDDVLRLGAHRFVDLESEWRGDENQADLVFDVLGGQVLTDSVALVRPGGTLVTIAEPLAEAPSGVRAVFFVVEPDRYQLAELARLVRDGRLTPQIGGVVSLEDAATAFTRRGNGKGRMIVGVAEDA